MGRLGKQREDHRPSQKNLKTNWDQTNFQWLQ